MSKSDEFRLVFSRLPSGVVVLTLPNTAGELRGMTISSFTALSLEPPLVLLCINRRSGCHTELARGVRFGISILSADQDAIAQQFARPGNKFEGVAYRFGATGVPLIDDCCGSLEAKIVDLHYGGDHTIFIGEVEHIGIGQRPPLIYHNRSYHTLSAASA